MKYNVYTKKKNWVSNPALEAETAVSCLPDGDRECCRWKVSKRLESPYD